MKTSNQFYVAEGILLRVNDVLFDLNKESETDHTESKIHVRAKCEQLLRELSYAGVVTADETKELVSKIGEMPFSEKPKGETK
jgi:hypothetical protein